VAVFASLFVCSLSEELNKDEIKAILKVENLHGALSDEKYKELLEALANKEPEQPVGSSGSPEMAAIAFAGVDGMAVTWYTESGTAGTIVKYGTASGSLDMTATGTAEAYADGHFHKVKLSGLENNKQYYYVCGSSEGWSEERSFNTSRAPGDLANFTIIVVGDMGLSHAADTMAAMRTLQPETDWYLHIGDISYADDFYLRLDTYQNSWDKWQRDMEPVTSKSAYMVLPGNHECTCNEVLPSLCPSSEKNFTAYNVRFRMPFSESATTSNMWYSFDYGGAHFVQINTESDYPDSPEGEGTRLGGGGFGDQITWLKNDLSNANANRHNTPWIIVSGHRPLYSRGGDRTSQKAAITAFEEIFHQNHVDLYLSGHIHWYERNYPIYQGNLVQKNYDNPSATTYIINGAAGNIEGHSKSDHGAQPWSAYLNDDVYGYGVLKIGFEGSNNSTLNWKWFDAANNALEDECTITKNL